MPDLFLASPPSQPRARYAPIDVAKRDREYALAIAEGRHSTTISVVCMQCREYCDGFWARTLDGRWICRRCAEPH